MFVIVMDRSVIICSIFLTLVAYSSCKSIGRNNENATASASTEPVSIDSPVLPEFSSENLAPESKLSTLLPSNDETRIRRSEVPDCSSHRNKKTKRCKSLLQRDTRSQLTSAEDRRSPKKTENYNLGAALSRSPGRPRIIEDDDYVCYCREKNNPLSRQNGQSQPWPRRNKPERRPDNKRMLPGESRQQKSPLYWHQPYLSDDIHQYLPNPLLGKRNPLSRNLGGLSYVPYVYYVDPSSLPMLPNQGQSPKNKHDTIVGQQTPGAYRNRPSVEQPCPPKQPTNRQRIPSVSSKTNKANGEPSGQRKTSGNNNFLQSAINSSKNPGNVPKDNDDIVGTAGPKGGHKSGSGTKHHSNVEKVTLRSTTDAYDGRLGVYTTENPLKDDLAGDKNIVLGNSNPAVQEEPSIDDPNETDDSVMKDNVAVGQSNPLPQKESPNEYLEKERGNTDHLIDDSENNENTDLGQSSPLPQEESPIEVLAEDLANTQPLNDDLENSNAALGQSNPLPQKPKTDIVDQNPGNMNPLKGNSGQNENVALGQSNPLPQKECPSGDLEEDLGNTDPLNDDSGRNDNAELGQSNPLPQEKSPNEYQEKEQGNTDLLNGDSANNDNAELAQSNPLPQEESPIEVLAEDPANTQPLNDDSENNSNAALGQSNPLPQEPNTDIVDQNPGNMNPLKGNSGQNENVALGQSNPLPQKESPNGDLEQDLGNTDPLNDDSGRNDNAELGQSNPLPQEESPNGDLEQDLGNTDPLNGDSANNDNAELGKTNPLPQKESPNEDLEEDLGNTDPLNDDSGRNDNAEVGKSTPLPQEPPTNTLNKNPGVSMDNDNDDPESSSQNPEIISNVGNINHDVTPGGFFADYSEDPLKVDQDDKVDARIGGAENQEGLPNDSSMNADVTPSSRNNEDLVNERETVGAGNPASAGIPKQSLPFCDNSLLEKSIKAVINNFAAENDGDTGQEMLGSARDDLLKEIVDVPNLKGILSLPPVERTVLDKVKNMLAKVTGVPRSKFDGEWPTSVIRNNLRHSLAAAPSAQTELPPNTVEERQFKGGKWISSFVTLEPMLKNEDRDEDSGDDERMRASVKSLLRDPAVSLEAAEHPIVQNMIVQSVHNTFPDSNSDLIQSLLDNELSLMKMEDVETTTADENIGQTQADDLEDIDMSKLLEIARDEAGITESTSIPDGLLESFTDGYKNSAVGSALSAQENAQTDLPGDIADQKGTSLGQEEESMVGKSKTPTGPNLFTGDVVPTISLFVTESPGNLVGVTNDYKITKYPGLSSTFSATQQPSPKINSPVVGQSIAKLIPENQEVWRKSVTENPCEVSSWGRITDESSGSVFPTTPFMVEDADSAGEMVGLQRSEEASPDYAYLGKITVQKNDYSDDIKSLQNSELFYVGDGVKLPLEIRRMSDGSYALSISRKVCEHLLNKDCPCCVPVEGNVLRKVRRQPRNEEETSVGNKKISKRESISAGSVDSDQPDSADDSLQISMPVETFARRYNLSLNLGKLQTPWKTDELEKNGATRFGKRDSANANLRSLLAVHGVPENGKSEELDDSYERSDDVISRYRRKKDRKLDKDRHERNIDEKVNKRVEIVTDVLYWLRDMILSSGA